MNRALPLLLLLAGCDLLEDDRAAPNCDPRKPFYEDADGDGVADEGGALYLGCARPDGFVDEPPPSASGPDSDAPDSDPPDSDPPDSDGPDTLPGDSDAPDTDEP